MRSGGSQRELLRVVDREKVEIHVGNDVSGRWRCRRRIDRPVAAAEHRQCEQAGEKKTIVKNSIVHKDSLSAATNTLQQTNAIFPKLAGRIPTLRRGAMRATTQPRRIDVRFCLGA